MGTATVTENHALSVGECGAVAKGLSRVCEVQGQDPNECVIAMVAKGSTWVHKIHFEGARARVDLCAGWGGTRRVE